MASFKQILVPPPTNLNQGSPLVANCKGQTAQSKQQAAAVAPVKCQFTQTTGRVNSVFPFEAPSREQRGNRDLETQQWVRQVADTVPRSTLAHRPNKSLNTKPTSLLNDFSSS